MRAVIFANGWMNQLVALRPDDILIAADGGARHCLAQGLHPEIVIGDLDSLNEDELARLVTCGTEIIQHPRRKDNTDLELALQHAHGLGVDEILILGALGARWDQSIVNILLSATQSPPRVSIIDGNQELFFLRDGDKIEIHGQPGDIVSLISLSERSCGVTTQNLEYPLHADELLLGSTLGISNVLLSECGSVSLLEGLMLCTVIHENT